MPPYFPQKHISACSLAVLRSVLALQGIEVTEETLISKVKGDYGKNFKNIWNPTLAKLAVEYGIPTKMYAKWPLFKASVIKGATLEYSKDPNGFKLSEYENNNDGDRLPEPLSLAYKEMFKAIELGCEVFYGRLTRQRLVNLVAEGYIIQTSIKTEKLYHGERPSYHSLLIYSIDGNELVYHDPARSAAMKCKVSSLIRAANDTGAFMAFKPQ